MDKDTLELLAQNSGLSFSPELQNFAEKVYAHGVTYGRREILFFLRHPISVEEAVDIINQLLAETKA